METINYACHTVYLDPMTGSGLMVRPLADDDVFVPAEPGVVLSVLSVHEADWNDAIRDLDKRHVKVDSTMATNLPRVYAAGDITEYPGKVRLIATGFGEAATAVNNAAVAIDPDAHLFPGHSSDNG